MYVQVFLIVHHAPLVRELAHIISSGNIAVSSDLRGSLAQVSCWSKNYFISNLLHHLINNNFARYEWNGQITNIVYSD